MNDLAFSTRNFRLHAARYFSHNLAAKIITAILFIALLVAIGTGVYLGVYHGFVAMNQQTYGQQTLPFYTYEIFFLVMSYLMFLSAIASSFFALARQDDEWIAATPKYKTLLTRAVRSVFFASLWPLLVLGVPAVLALRSVYASGADAAYGTTFVATGLIGLIIIAAIACTLAIALVLALAEILHAFRALRMKWLVMTTIVVLALATWAIIRQVFAMNILALFVSGPVTATTATITGIVAAFRFLPTQLMAFLMLNLQNGATGSAWTDIGWLALITIAIGAIIYFLSFDYLHVWQKLEEGSFEARTEISGRKTASSGTGFLRSAKTSTAAIFYKETVVNIRNLKNATWLFFMLALWVIQTALNIFLRWNIQQYGVHAQTVAVGVQSLQLVTATFFVSAFVLRFVLPSFSSERRMAWILGTAPISLRRVFFSKLTFYSAIFLALGLVLGIVNSAILGLSLLNALGFLALLGIMIICVTTFGFSLGAIFPDTESDDPEAVSTSLPGLAFTFISLLYGACGAWLYYVGLNAESATSTSAFGIISAALVLAMIATTIYKLKTFNPFAEA
jgi:hypothetical protein